MDLKDWRVPQDKVFFDRLEQESASVVQAGHELREMIEKFDRLERGRPRQEASSTRGMS